MKILPILFLSLTLSACSTSTTEPDETSDGFTPPAGLYFKLDGVVSSPSADKCNVNDGTIRITKAFDLGTEGVRNGSLIINHSLPYVYRNDSLKNGDAIPMYLSNNYGTSRDSAVLSVTMDFYPTGVYELIGVTGKIWMSKVNDTIQVTSNGPITLTGKNSLPPFETQTRTTEFNLRNQVSF